MRCPECDRLRIEFDRIVRRNMDVVSDYNTAVLKYEQERVELLRAALHDVELLRTEARIKLASHEETHFTERVMTAGQ